MRNLKKILALALALVMTLSVMTVASAKSLGEYTDAASVSAKHEVAVDVATQLGILQGMTETTYAPQGTLTRAQLATMIYRITTGDVAGTYVKNFAAGAAAKFSDVSADAWYAGYVGYCADAGYLQGWDGKYSPNTELTGYQALAALLRAIGYNQPGEFTGADWTVRVAQIATQSGVSVGVVTDLNKAITREQAAEFIYNALFTAQVTYTPAFGYSASTVVTGKGTLARDVFKIVTSKDGIAGDGDVFNRPNTVWVKTNGAVAVSIAAKPVKTYTTAVTQCQMSTDLGMTGTWTAQRSINGNPVDSVSVVSTNVAAAVTGTAQGTLTEVYFMGYAAGLPVYRLVEIETWLAQVTGVRKQVKDIAGHEVVSSLTTYTVYDPAGNGTWTYGTEEYALYSYALLTYSNKTNALTGTAYGIQSITPVTPSATAALSSFTAATTTLGTVYNNANKFVLGKPSTIAEIGTTYNVFVDAYGNVIGLTVPNTIYNYGVMSAIAWQPAIGLSNEHILANVVAMNGVAANNVVIGNRTWTNAGYGNGSFSTKDSASVSHDMTKNGAFYTNLYQFTTSSTGAYTVTAVGSAADVDSLVNSNPYITCNDGANKLIANDNTVYLIKTLVAGVPTYTTYTGYKTVPSMTIAGSAANASFFLNSTGAYVQYIYIDATAASFTGTMAEAIIFDDTADSIGALYGYNMYFGATAALKDVAPTAAGVAQTLADVGYIGEGAYFVQYNAAGQIVALVANNFNTTGYGTLTATYCDGTVIRDAAGTAYNCTGMDIYLVSTALDYVVAGTVADVAATTGVVNYLVFNALGQVVATYVFV